MAILTWQNVPILSPESGANLATRNAMDALGNLGNSLSGWAAGAQQRAALAADRNILGNMAGVQDPVEYMRMLQEGSIIDGNLSNASPDTLRAALGYTGVLQKGVDDRYKSQRTRMLDANLDEATDQINDAMAYSALGLFPEATETLHGSRLHAAHSGEWWDRLGKDRAEDGRMERSRLRSQRGNEQYADLKHARTFADSAYHVWKTDPDEGMAMLQRGVANGEIDGNQAFLVQQELRKRYENEYGAEAFKQRFGEGEIPGSSSSGGVQFGGNRSQGKLNAQAVGGSGRERRAAARNMVVAGGQIPQAGGGVRNIQPEFLYGRPLEELSWDQYRAWTKESQEAWQGADPKFLERWGYGPDDGQWSTAAGKYQVTSKNMEELLQRGVIKESDGNPFSEAVQEKAGRYLFEDARRNGVPLHTVWPSLPDAFKDKDFGRDLDFDDIAPYLALHEAQGAPPRFNAEVGAAKRFLEEPDQRLDHAALAFRRANETPDRTKSEVMEDLLKNKAITAMDNADPAKLEKAFNQLREINPKLTPSQIGAILAEAPRNPKWFGEDDAANRKALAASAAEILQTVQQREEFEQGVERLDTLQQNYDQQLARYEEARQRAEHASAKDKPRLERQRMKMLKELDDISKEIERNIGSLAAQEEAEEAPGPAREDARTIVSEIAAPAKERAQTAFNSSLEEILASRPNISPEDALRQAKGRVSRAGEDLGLVQMPTTGEVQQRQEQQAVRAAGDRAFEQLGRLDLGQMNAVEAGAHVQQILGSLGTETLPNQELAGVTSALLHTLGFEQGTRPEHSRQTQEPNMEVAEGMLKSIIDRRLDAIDAAAQSAPVASNPQKAPVPVDASETVRVGPQGAGEAVLPPEIDPADLGPVRTVVKGKRIPKGQAAKVIATFVEDGDTFDYGSDGFSGTCRLDFVDAPETAKTWKGQPDQAGSREAKKTLQRLVEKREVTVTVTDQDKHDRDICQVEVSGKDVSLELVKAAVAWVRQEFVPRSNERAMNIMREFQGAQSQGRGIFSDPAAISPWAFRSRYSDTR